MKINNRLPLERLIGKIDNDFNISESDWIPRVAAWTIDALSQLKVLPMERKKRDLEVSEGIAQFPCELNATDIKVYDANGCEIESFENVNSCGCSNTKNRRSQESVVNKCCCEKTNSVTTRDISGSYSNEPKHFILNGNQIEVNFDTDSITVETYEVATYYDEYYECEVPYIYDNGLLLEALAWYCLFKYLSRGSKHPVFDLNSNNPVTNPWTQWNSLKYKAANATKKAITKDSNGWNNFFYNATFLPRL